MTNGTVTSDDSSAATEPQTASDALCMPAEKAYYLQRIQVLEETQKELVAWAKGRFWAISVMVLLIGFFGGKEVLQFVTEEVAKEEVTNLANEQFGKEATKVEAQLELFQSQLKKANDQITELEAQSKRASGVVKEIDSTIEQAKQSAGIVESARKQTEQVQRQIIAILDSLTTLEASAPDPQAPLTEREQELIKRVEALEKDAAAHLDTSETLAATTQAPEQNDDDEWQNILGESWVKPNDIIGRTYSLEIASGLYLWPTKLDADSTPKKAQFLINTSSRSRRSGSSVVPEAWAAVGSEVPFTHQGQEYRMTIVDVKPAGKIRSNALFVTVDKKR